MQSQKDKSPEDIDYEDIVTRYNQLSPGQRLRLPRVYNITSFRKALERRGVVHRVDFRVAHKGPNCVLKRLSEVPMTTR